MIPIEGMNLDIGGGKYDSVTEMYSEHGAENVVYDPFNRSAEHNARALRETNFIEMNPMRQRKYKR